jgi:hypothetical protein
MNVTSGIRNRPGIAASAFCASANNLMTRPILFLITNISSMRTILNKKYLEVYVVNEQIKYFITVKIVTNIAYVK